MVVMLSTMQVLRAQAAIPRFTFLPIGLAERRFRFLLSTRVLSGFRFLPLSSLGEEGEEEEEDEEEEEEEEQSDDASTGQGRNGRAREGGGGGGGKASAECGFPAEAGGPTRRLGQPSQGCGRRHP